MITSPLPAAGRYRLQTPIGSGGMGQVFRAYDRLTDSDVALKQVHVPTTHLQFNSRNGGEQGEDALRLALAREFSILARMRHPHIISVYDYGFFTPTGSGGGAPQPYFTMELLPGPQPITHAARGLPLSEKIALVVDMLQALAYLHRRGIVHRDLKPANVLVQDGRLRVLDFGLALARETIADDAAAGTLTYMAPEVLAGEEAAPASDLFAAGLIAYEILTGHYPFKGDTPSQIVTSLLKDQPVLASLELPDDLKWMLSSLLDKSPSRRPRDAMGAIEQFTRGTALPVIVETPAVRESYLRAARFIGREREFGQLCAVIDAIQSAVSGNADTPHSWLIGGESGVGKSRLIDEVAIYAQVAGFLVLRGQGVSGGGVPYQVWRQPLRRLVLTAPSDDTDIALLRYAGLLPARETTAEQGATAQLVQPQQLIPAVLRLFERQTHPILLVLEDLHWTQESLDILRPLAALAESLPLMIVGSYRDDERPGLPQKLPGMQHIKLARFQGEEIEQLTVAMLGDAGQRPELLELLHRETEGNALFVVEVIRVLTESVQQLGEIGYMKLPEQVSAGEVQAILRRRLNRLPDWAQEILKRAAIAGRQVDPAVLGVHERSQQRLADFLSICEATGVLEVREDTWYFSHDKLREVILSSLRAEERPTLYRQVAEAVETAAGEHADDRALLLASLWRVADDAAKEGYYSAIGGRQAKQAADFQTAHDLLQRALALDAHLAIAARQPVDARTARAELLTDAAEVAGSIGAMEQAIEFYEQALQLYRELCRPLRAAFVQSGLGDVRRKLGQHDQAQELIEGALALQREHHANRDAALSLLNLGVVYAMQDAHQPAIQAFQESLDLARALDDKWLMTKAMNNLGNMHRNIDDRSDAYERSMEYYEQTLALRREIDDREGIAKMLVNMGSAANWFNDFPTAERYLQEGIEMHRELGMIQGVAHAMLQLGNVALRARSDYQAAESHIQQALDICQRTGDTSLAAMAAVEMAKLLIRLDELDESEEYLLKALRWASELNAKLTIGDALHRLGIIWQKRRDYKRALELFTVMMPCFAGVPSRMEDGRKAIEELKTLMAEAPVPELDPPPTLEAVLHSLLSPGDH